jgi:hypothetical protein
MGIIKLNAVYENKCQKTGSRMGKVNPFRKNMMKCIIEEMSVHNKSQNLEQKYPPDSL